MLQSAFYAHSVEFAMRALSCLGCLLLLASANAVAGPVYKWKDANGVTQYSETPPAGRKFETRAQARSPQAGASAETPAAPVFVDGKKTVTLRGPAIAADFQVMVADYIERRFGSGSTEL